MEAGTFVELVIVAILFALWWDHIRKHQHKLEVKGVEHSEVAGFSQKGTIVFYVCKCGECKTAVIAGTWKLEDFGQKKQTDDEFAKQAGIRL